MASKTEEKIEDLKKYITPKEAWDKIKDSGINITYATLLTWVEKNKMGFQPGGPGSKWCVDREKIDELIAGRYKKGVGTDGKK